MDKKALQLLSRFSLPPNALGYCGKDSAPEKFKKCVIEGKCSGVSNEIKKFIVLNPYLKTLGEVTGKNPFSCEVAEAYWIGNRQLKKTKLGDYKILLKYLEKQGVPEWILKDLKERWPKKFIPTHLFQILHVGVGRASGSVPYNLNSINNCMIRWGKVKKISEKDVLINVFSLARLGKGYKLVTKEKGFTIIPGFSTKLKIGDEVAVHWGHVIKKLNKSEVKKISFWTKEVLKSVNSISV